jgi:murein DD-endopeptidase MepM/ murein hydrolase activator NlpD
LRRGAILADKRFMTRAPLLLAALAAACASAQPAPITYRSGQQQAPQSPPAAAEAASGAIQSSPRPAPARSEPDWADGEGTPLSTYALRPEDAQPFDPARLPRTHRVRGEESLYDIAETYQAPLRALIDQNGLEPPYALEPGRELELPPPRFHAVARGESFEDVAQQYNVDLRSLALLNRMSPPYRVRTGDRIVLPAMARAHAPPADVGEAPAVSGASARFQLPLRGRILARFGVQPGGVRVDGLEIAGREGDEIAAAADGDVVYAGSDLPAYGTLVLVRHADEYVTAYGFARRALVREGQRVRAGQAIAELGSRPDGRPRLLFQVRRGAAAVDPAPLLGIGE